MERGGGGGGRETGVRLEKSKVEKEWTDVKTGS